MPSVKAVKAEFQKMLDNISDIGNLYKKNEVKRTGKVENINYAEIYAKYLLKNDYYLKLFQIQHYNRNNYRVHGRVESNTKKPKYKRFEDLFARKLYKNRVGLSNLGQPFYYQVPLKENQQSKGGGKIDLVSFFGKKVIYLIELKYGENKESLLRAVLEVHTYYQRLNLKNFINSFPAIKGVKPNNIKKAVLLGPETKAYIEARNLNSQGMSNLKELIKKLNVGIFYYAPEKASLL